MNKLTKQNAPFTQVPNELLVDRCLSLKAKGLYALMYSKPDGWQFYETALAKECRDGKDAVSSALDELVKQGWLLRSGGREEGTNRFCAYDYELLVSRDARAVAEKPSRESRDGKPATSNTEPSNTEKVIPPTPKGEPDGFEEIWKAKWSRGTAPNPRQPALKAYAAALKRGSSPAEILAGVKARVGVDKEDTVYAPQLVTWLNQERWKDGTGAAVMNPVDMEASAKRLEESKRRHDAEMARLAEERSNQLLRRLA